MLIFALVKYAIFSLELEKKSHLLFSVEGISESNVIGMPTASCTLCVKHRGEEL